MERTLSLRELRQNPTSAIDAVESGEIIVITRHSRPIADLVPHRTRGATPRALAALLGRVDVDVEWAQDLAAQRSEPTRDVWGDGR